MTPLKKRGFFFYEAEYNPRHPFSKNFIRIFMQKQSPLSRFLIKHNREQSKIYSDPGNVLWRRQYRAKHPTEIAALKCMDGRLHLPVMTETPLGIIQPFRNIGGQFDLGWPFFGILLKEWVEYSVKEGRDCLILVTYHYSKGDHHRGCKGFGYDTEAAKEATKALKKQIEGVFGVKHNVVYPILVGIETDEDALILHGEDGTIIDLSKEKDSDPDHFKARIQRAFPDMRLRIVDDLLPLLLGNIRHIKEVQKSKRTPIQADHMEQILGVGRGFDWLHLHNKALLIGPFSYDLRDPITKAAGILLDIIRAGRIKKKDVVLIASAVYRNTVGIEKQLAEEKARSLSRFAYKTIKENVPELMKYLSVLVGTVDMNTRLFTEIPFKK